MLIITFFIVLVFLFTLISKRIERTIITAPIIFTVAGMLLYYLSPKVAETEIQHESVLLLAELTLALLLFTDASRIQLRKVLKETILPERLLGVGMPLTIIAGTIVAIVLFRGISIWEAALLAVILAPTDASLGQVVVQSRLVPESIRQALNVESGLNDGLSMPFFTLFLGLAAINDLTFNADWVIYTGEQIFLALLVGIAFGWIGGWLIGEAGSRDWIDEPLQQLGLLALALMTYGGAVMIGGNGFIASFLGGLLVKRGFEDAHYHANEFSEAWGQLLNYFVFFIFGVIAFKLVPVFTGTIILFAILSLTIVRMLPVAVALLRSRVIPATTLFMGWFGPRGLASVVLGLIYLEHEANLPYEETIIVAVTATVLLSIIAHGVSAVPGIKLYAQKVAQLDESSTELGKAFTPATGKES